MTRPSQLALIAFVYLAGAGAAHSSGTWSAGAAVIGLLVLLAVSASVHLVNEYADAESDPITRRTPFSGGSGALQHHDLSRAVPLTGAALALAAGLGGGFLATWTGHLSPVALTLLIIGAAGGWLYSVPPKLALSRRGLGEMGNALLGGLLLPVYGFAVQVGTVTAWAVIAFVPFALVDFASVMATAWPDRGADALVGKRTLAVRWPARRLRATFATSAVLALAVLLAATDRALPVTVAVASLAVLPFAAVAVLRFARIDSPTWAVATMVGLITVQLVAWWSLAPGAWAS